MVCRWLYVYENMVALTGIEPATLQFSSVQLGLSGCVFGPVQFATKAFVAVRMADVLPWCCPAAGIRLITGQSNTRPPARQHISRERNAAGWRTNQPDVCAVDAQGDVTVVLSAYLRSAHCANI